MDLPFTSFAGVIFQLIGEQRLDYNSVLIGFPLGLVFGLLELFLFPKAEMRFRQWSFTKILIFKTLLYTAVIYVVTVTLATISGLSEGRKWSELPALLASPGLLILVVYSLVIYGLLCILSADQPPAGRRDLMEIHSWQIPQTPRGGTDLHVP